MRRVVALSIGAVILWAGAAFAQSGEKSVLGEILTNDDIIKLHEAGVDEELILLKIKASNCQFDMSVDEMVKLKKAGLAKEVLLTMWSTKRSREQHQTQSMEILFEFLRSGQEDYDRAVRQFVRIGKDAVPEVIEKMLGAENHRIRAGCAEILQKIGDGRSLEPLLQMLDDREPAVRAKAAEAVAALSTKDTAARLIEKVKKKAVDLDGYLLALGHMKEKAAIEEVTKVLKSGAPARDRSAAAFSLGLIGDREAIKTLMNVIADDSVPEVRVSSCRSLVRFAAKEALPAVLKAIDRYPDTRAELASQLRNWKEEKSVEALIELLRDPDKDVKDAAWDSLKILTGAALGRNHEDWQSWWELAKIRGGVRF